GKVHLMRQSFALHQPPSGHQQLACKGNDGPLRTDLLHFPLVKGCQRSVARADNLEGSLNEERSQQWRTVLADPPSPVLLPGLMNGGVQARVAHNLLGPLEALGITNMGYERRCYDRTHTGQADQSPGRVVVGQGPVDHAGDVVDLVFEMLPLAP